MDDPLEDGDYFVWIRQNNDAIVEAIEQAPQLQLSSCPGWVARDLLPHLGSFYDGWYRYSIVCPPDEGDIEAALASASPPPTDPAEWLTYFTETATRFLALAESIDLDSPTWTYVGAQPARFWLHRVAVETTLHRWDVEHELGRLASIPSERAIAAIDNTLRAFFPTAVAWGTPLPSAPLSIEATDTPARWIAVPQAGTVIVSGSDVEHGDTTLRGPSSALLLHLWGRNHDNALEGDPQVQAEWRSVIATLSSF